MNELIDIFDSYQKRLIDKQKTIDLQRNNIHHSINRAFNKIFEQLIEIRRFCRNDLEQQTINAQIELQQMLDMIQYMRTKTIMYYNHKPDLLRSFRLELDIYENRLSKINLSQARDLDNLSSYLTSSFSSILPSTDVSHELIQPSIKDTPTSPSQSENLVSTNDLNHFKFGPSIVLAYPCDMIASNGRTILSYVIEKNYLNYSTIAGVHLSSKKVHRLLAPITSNNVRLWDLAWCPWSKFYLIVGNLGLYSLCYPYDTNPYTNEHLPQVTRLISFHGLTCQHVRISSHELGWFIYMIEHQNVSLDLYDRRSGQRLRHFDNSLQHDCLPLGFHGFCLNKNLFAIVKKIEVLSTINNRHQIENEQNVEIYFYDLHTMLCIQQMSLCHCSNVYDIKCCYEKNYFFILAEPMQLILVDLNTNEFIRKKLLDEGKHLCMINDHEMFILRSECSIQTLQYRNVR